MSRKNMLLKYHIMKSGYSIKKISSLLNVNPMTVTNWVNGRNFTNIYQFVLLCNLIDLDPRNLLDEKHEKLNINSLKC